MLDMKLYEIANNPNINLSFSTNQYEHPKDASLRRFKEVTLGSVYNSLG